MSATMRETITLNEAAERLGVSYRFARKAAQTGDLPVICLCGRFLVLRKPFERMLMQQNLAAKTASSSSR